MKDRNSKKAGSETISSEENSKQQIFSPIEDTGEVNSNSVPGYNTANAITYGLIKSFREELKDNPTQAEKLLWEFLRNKKIGYKIRRQHIIDDFITDFVCLRKKLVIEIDGKIHLKYREYDALRTFLLNQKGYEVIRFTNEEVFANPREVAIQIKQKLDKREVI